MMVSLVLLSLGALAAVVAPRLLSRGDWQEREPVVALWVWQCFVGAILLCFALSMIFSAAATWQAVRDHMFAPAPQAVVHAYSLGRPRPWAALITVALASGALWTAVMLAREVHQERGRIRRHRTELLVRSPMLPGESRGNDPFIVLEGERPDVWWLSGATPRLVITTAALRRLKGRQLDAVLAHEQGHARARHHWLRHCSAALANGFPQVPVFAVFREEMHRLIELAADDVASRRFGRRTIALALVELNEDRGVFGPGTPPEAELPRRVHRLLSPAPRLSAGRRLQVTAAASLVPVLPLVVAFGPGLHALG